MTTAKEAASKVLAFAKRLMERPPTEAIDVEFDHPSEDGAYVVAYADWLIHGREMRRVARGFIPAAAWGGGEVELDTLRALLASALPEVSDGRQLYVRWHDSAWSLSLRSGEEIWDRKRPDRVPPPRRPVRKEVFPEPSEDGNGEVIRRGAAIDMLQPHPALPADQLLEQWLQRGVRVALTDEGRTVWHLTYIAPFVGKVCGVWIGASAYQVEQHLGAPADEVSTAHGRRGWIYEHDGHLFVGFDDDDRVDCIGR